MIRLFSKIKVGMMVFALVACSKSCGKNHSSMKPEEVVESYLNIALNMTRVSQKNDLLEFTTGALKSAIVGASEDTIRKAYIDRTYKIQSFTVLERKDRTPRETEITFELKYQDLGDTPDQKLDEAALTTAKNTVSLIRENNVWLIRDVIGSKTSVDFPLASALKVECKPGEPCGEAPIEEPATTDLPMELPEE